MVLIVNDRFNIRVGIYALQFLEDTRIISLQSIIRQASMMEIQCGVQ
jgi:hypothetical protein